VNAARRLFALLGEAKKPLIIAGTQVYWDGAHEALRELTDQTGIPVFTNGAGRGTLPMNHPHCFRYARSAALRQADAVLLLGTPLDFRLKYGKKGWNPEGRLIQVESNPADLNRNREADLALVADSRLLLEALGEGLQGHSYAGWLAELQELEREKAAELERWKAIDDVPVNHFRFGAALDEVVDEDTIIVGDGGNIVSACAKVIELTYPGQWLDPGPLGCLGVGLPFAVAVKHLRPDKKVLVINGDGSSGFNGFEFDTAVRFGLPLVSVVGNDAGWGQIRDPQVGMVGRERAVATSLAPTRYDEIVVAMGGHGQHVERPEEIKAAVERAFASGRPACVDVALDPEGLAKTGASAPYIL
jgi:acetolactate synthase-1/2/3 large subunit